VGVDNGIDVDTVWNELDTINAGMFGCAVGMNKATFVKSLMSSVIFINAFLCLQTQTSK